MRKIVFFACVLVPILFFSVWAYSNHCSDYAAQQFDYLKSAVTEQYRPGYLSAYSESQLSKYTAAEIPYLMKAIPELEDVAYNQVPREVKGYMENLQGYSRFLTFAQNRFIQNVPKHMERRETRWAEVIQRLKNRLACLTKGKARVEESICFFTKTLDAFNSKFDEIVHATKYLPYSDKTMKDLQEEARLASVQTLALYDETRALGYTSESFECSIIHRLRNGFCTLLDSIDSLLARDDVQVFPLEDADGFSDDADYQMMVTALDETLRFRQGFDAALADGTIAAGDLVDMRQSLSALRELVKELLNEELDSLAAGEDQAERECWDELSSAFISLEVYFNEILRQADNTAEDIIAENLRYLDKFENALTAAMEARDRGDTRGMVYTLDNLLAEGLRLGDEFYAADEMMKASNTLPGKAVLRANIRERYFRLFKACDCLYDGKPVMTR